MNAIAFICTANLCRSPMAHAICAAEVAQRSLPIAVFSAGIMNFTGIDVTLDAALTCSRNGTPVVKRGATFVSTLPFAEIERFFVMEQKHLAALTREYGVDAARITLLGTWDPQGGPAEIEDPINQPIAAFEACYQRVRRCIQHYFEITGGK